jgi:hypothetical protein
LSAEKTAKNVKSRPRWLRILLWGLAAILLLAVALSITTAILLQQAEPFLRARVVDTLAERFNARVDLDQFHASASNGFEVSGTGLRITPHGLEAYPPVISVDRFYFHMWLTQLFSAKRHVRMVHVDGLHLSLPPKAVRPHLLGQPGGKLHRISDPKIFVDEILAHDAQITILPGSPAPNKPPKVPLEFNIHELHLVSNWTTGAMHYTASLTNPKPIGEIQSEGEFGPWNEDDPRTTPVSGRYSFDHADLATIKGIAGILASTGNFSGPLDHLTVDGETRTPDFRIAEAGHPVALSTTFHAIVDGTTGDTYLQPVQAHFRNTWFTCNGSIVRVPQQGHHIILQINMTKARIEDLLWLAIKTDPPVITGAVRMNTAFDLPPDPTHSVDVAGRLGLRGSFTVTGVQFTNPETDRKIDSYSLRTQGKPDEANAVSHSQGRDSADLPATLFGNFTLQQAMLNLHPAEFKVQGIDATFSGNYSLDGQQFDFSGNAKLQATVSQMFTGWKSTLLKPLDPFFKRHGAGTYVPFRVSGTKEAPKFGIELGKHTIDVPTKHSHDSQQ